MKCLNCGNENSNNSVFCSTCGSRLQQPATSNYQVNPSNNVVENQHKTNSKKTLIIILAVVGGLFVLGAMTWGGVYLYTQYKLKQTDKKLQDQIGDIGDLDSIIVPDDEINKVVKYSIGELVTLIDGSTWYVMSQENKNVTLLSTENYGDETPFSTLVNDYDQSIVKDIIENDFLPKLKTSVSAKGGNISNLSARIISVDDIKEILNLSSSVANKDIEISSSYKWLFETGSYWTSTHTEDPNFDLVYVVVNWAVFASVTEDPSMVRGQKFNVRPVIETTIDNLK